MDHTKKGTGTYALTMAPCPSSAVHAIWDMVSQVGLVTKTKEISFHTQYSPSTIHDNHPDGLLNPSKLCAGLGMMNFICGRAKDTFKLKWLMANYLTDRTQAVIHMALPKLKFCFNQSSQLSAVGGSMSVRILPSDVTISGPIGSEIC